MKLITLSNLQSFKQKIDALFVKKEKKTGSDTEYRTLSDNNLTDELVAKINAAGAATEVTQEIATAKTEAIAASKSYTDTEIASAKAYTDTAKTEAVSTSKSYTDGEITAAKSYADTEIGKAKTAAIEDAHSYTDTAKAQAISSANTYTDTAKTEAVSTSKSYTDTEVASAKAALESTINTKISTAYKIKGSIAFATLPTLAEAEEGNVYNITDTFTTTDSFVEGAGKKYPAGANVVCVEASAGVFKWDVLAGFIDTDSFVKNADIETVTEAEINALFAA